MSGPSLGGLPPTDYNSSVSAFFNTPGVNSGTKTGATDTTGKSTAEGGVGGQFDASSPVLDAPSGGRTTGDVLAFIQSMLAKSKKQLLSNLDRNLMYLGVIAGGVAAANNKNSGGSSASGSSSTGSTTAAKTDPPPSTPSLVDNTVQYMDSYIKAFSQNSSPDAKQAMQDLSSLKDQLIYSANSMTLAQLLSFTDAITSKYDPLASKLGVNVSTSPAPTNGKITYPSTLVGFAGKLNDYVSAAGSNTSLNQYVDLVKQSANAYIQTLNSINTAESNQAAKNLTSMLSNLPKFNTLADLQTFTQNLASTYDKLSSSLQSSFNNKYGALPTFTDLSETLSSIMDVQGGAQFVSGQKVAVDLLKNELNEYLAAYSKIGSTGNWDATLINNAEAYLQKSLSGVTDNMSVSDVNAFIKNMMTNGTVKDSVGNDINVVTAIWGYQALDKNGNTVTYVNNPSITVKIQDIPAKLSSLYNAIYQVSTGQVNTSGNQVLNQILLSKMDVFKAAQALAMKDQVDQMQDSDNLTDLLLLKKKLRGIPDIPVEFGQHFLKYLQSMAQSAREIMTFPTLATLAETGKANTLRTDQNSIDAATAVNYTEVAMALIQNGDISKYAASLYPDNAQAAAQFSAAASFILLQSTLTDAGDALQIPGLSAQVEFQAQVLRTENSILASLDQVTKIAEKTAEKFNLIANLDKEVTKERVKKALEEVRNQGDNLSQEDLKTAIKASIDAKFPENSALAAEIGDEVYKGVKELAIGDRLYVPPQFDSSELNVKAATDSLVQAIQNEFIASGKNSRVAAQAKAIAQEVFSPEQMANYKDEQDVRDAIKNAINDRLDLEEINVGVKQENIDSIAAKVDLGFPKTGPLYDKNSTQIIDPDNFQRQLESAYQATDHIAPSSGFGLQIDHISGIPEAPNNENKSIAGKVTNMVTLINESYAAAGKEVKSYMNLPPNEQINVDMARFYEPAAKLVLSWGLSYKAAENDVKVEHTISLTG